MIALLGQKLLTQFAETLRGSHFMGLRLTTKAMGQAVPVIAHKPAAKKGAQR